MESAQTSKKQMTLFPETNRNENERDSGPREEKDLRAWLRSLPPGSKLKVRLPREK